MYQVMAEIIFMKTIKLFITLYCYFGTTIIAFDQVSDVDVADALNVSPAMQHIILWLLVVFWVIKIVWFVYEKFYLERKERLLGMDKTKEEIEDLKESHK